jgi:hypothetical protein
MQIIDCAQIELYTNNLGGYKVGEKLNLGISEQKRLNTTDLRYQNISLHKSHTFRKSALKTVTSKRRQHYTEMYESVIDWALRR